MEEFSGIRVEIKDYIGVVTFDRPPVNATSRPMVASIQRSCVGPRMLKRVFDIDMERRVCGGKLKFVAVIE